MRANRAGGANSSHLKFNAYAAATAYREPNSASDGPYQYAYNTPLNMFAYMQAHPPMGPQFNHHMGGYRQGRPSWMDEGFFPVRERLVKEARTDDAEAVFIVDIGGSIGHDLAEFARKHPDAPGRLVLQDLPAVLGQIASLDGRIERMEYDFYTEQPVKGTSVLPFSPSGRARRKNTLATNTCFPPPSQAPAPTTCTRSCTTGRTTSASRSSATSRPPCSAATASY